MLGYPTYVVNGRGLPRQTKGVAMGEMGGCQGKQRALPFGRWGVAKANKGRGHGGDCHVLWLLERGFGRNWLFLLSMSSGENRSFVSFE